VGSASGRALAGGLLLAAVVVAGPVRAQTLPRTDLLPGSSWATSEAREGAITREYDGVFNRTEVRMRIVPQREGDAANPTTLYVSAIFPGRAVKVTPDRVWLRAQSDLTVQPRRLRVPTLAISGDGSMMVNVSSPAPDSGAWLNYPCGSADACAFDGLVVPVPIVGFFKLLQARRVWGEAMGFPFSLSPKHIEMLTEFARELVPRER
jgi:hypothetical protein